MIANLKLTKQLINYSETTSQMQITLALQTILQDCRHDLTIHNIGGIYHATSTVLGPLDRTATKFVHELNLEVDFAFVRYNLTPLSLSRDIAMLDFLHKTYICLMPIRISPISFHNGPAQKYGILRV